MRIRSVLLEDLDACCRLEADGFPSGEAAGRESIRRRIEVFPGGFLVAEDYRGVLGMVNSAATHKDDISDEGLKQLIGHDPQGKNLVIFSLVVLPELRQRGIAGQLLVRFIEDARSRRRANVLLICKQPLIGYYQRAGFDHVGLSRSTHGGAQWHEMRLALTPGQRSEKKCAIDSPTNPI